MTAYCCDARVPAPYLASLPRPHRRWAARRRQLEVRVRCQKPRRTRRVLLPEAGNRMARRRPPAAESPRAAKSNTSREVNTVAPPQAEDARQPGGEQEVHLVLPGVLGVAAPVALPVRGVGRGLVAATGNSPWPGPRYILPGREAGQERRDGLEHRLDSSRERTVAAVPGPTRRRTNAASASDTASMCQRACSEPAACRPLRSDDERRPRAA